jgi:hypothetical protein
MRVIECVDFLKVITAVKLEVIGLQLAALNSQ